MIPNFIQPHGALKPGNNRVATTRHSLAETAMFRLKMFFGGYLKNNRPKTQTTEVYARYAWVYRKQLRSWPAKRPRIRLHPHAADLCNKA